MKKFMKSLAIVAMALSLVACGGSDKKDDKKSGDTDKKSIVYNLGSEPPELNSILTTSTGSGNVLRHVIDGLTMLDENDEPQPAAAESWEISEDGKTYTFKIREGVKWSNGEEVTANDFVFAWDQMFTLSNAAQYAATWAPFIEGAEEALSKEDDKEAKEALKNIGYKAIDDYTLEVKTTAKYDFFLGILAFYSFAPVNEKGFNDAGGIDKYAKEADAIVTNGAFKMDKWTHEDSIVLTKNEDYWNADKINLDEIKFTMIADANTAINEFKTGGVDIIEPSGQDTINLEKEGFKKYSFDDASAWYLEFNTTLPGLNNAKVRKALALAVDAQKYIDNVVLNDSKVANSFTPPAIVQGEFAKEVGDLMNRPKEDDYSEVVKLFEEGLKEEGITKEDLKVALITDDTTAAQKYGAYIQEQLKSVLGISIEVSPMTYKARIAAMQSHDFDIVMAGWGPDYNDPMTFLSLFVSTNDNNHTQWANVEYDEIISKALIEADSDKRTELLIQAENMLADEMPVGYIYNRTKNYFMTEGITGVIKTGFTDIDLRYADKK